MPDLLKIPAVQNEPWLCIDLVYPSSFAIVNFCVQLIVVKTNFMSQKKCTPRRCESLRRNQMSILVYNGPWNAWTGMLQKPILSLWA